MKKTLLMTALVTSLCSQAQIGKGRMMIGASFNYNQNKSTQNDSLGFIAQQNTQSGFTPTLRYGYFITDHIMVGVYGSYNRRKSETTQNYYYSTIKNINKSTENTYTGGLFGRYYQMIGKSRFAVFGELRAAYGAGKGTQEYGTENYGIYTPHINTYKQSNLLVNINPGMVFFATKNIAVETSFGGVGYNWQNSKSYNSSGKEISETSNGSFNSYLNFSLASVYLGVNFYFGGHRDQAAPVN